MEKLQTQLGISNITKMLDEVSGIIEDGYAQFKDGVQLWDLAFIPKGLKHIMVIAKVFPEAMKESKDLSIEELAEVVGYLVNNILSIFDKYKKLAK